MDSYEKLMAYPDEAEIHLCLECHWTPNQKVGMKPVCPECGEPLYMSNQKTVDTAKTLKNVIEIINRCLK